MRNYHEGYHKKGGQNPLPPSSGRPAGPVGSQRRVGIASGPNFRGVTPPEPVNEHRPQRNDADRKLNEYPHRDDILGKVHARLQVFLYLIMRDAAPTGAVAETVQNIVSDTQTVPPEFSNKELAEMADRYADKLMAGI